MPELTLKFSIPEEENEFRMAMDGGRWFNVVTDLDAWLRQQVKYADTDTVTVAEVSGKLSELVAEAGLELF